MTKWVKGQSGNPGGRPKVLGDLRELARQHAPAAIKELVRLARNAKSETARVAAIRELLDRGYGKPGQLISGINEREVERPEPTNEQIARALALLIAEARLKRKVIPELTQLAQPVE
jgi:hypothetical protein